MKITKHGRYVHQNKSLNELSSVTVHLTKSKIRIAPTT